MDWWIVIGAVVVVLLIGVAVAASRNRGPELGPRPPAAPGGLLTCPACAHRFKMPDIMIVTKAQVRQYGPNPVQCPTCAHIWSAGRA